MAERSMSSIDRGNLGHGVDQHLMTSQVSKWKQICFDALNRIKELIGRHVQCKVLEEFKRFQKTGFQTLVRYFLKAIRKSDAVQVQSSLGPWTR